jgi:dTDP-4-dehydrorhamnose 3,5-epimerase
MMYSPKGFAHGFLTLKPDTEVFYLVDAPYSPEAERGVRWNDPTFAIAWPAEPQVVSEKDASWPSFDRAYHLGS